MSYLSYQRSFWTVLHYELLIACRYYFAKLFAHWLLSSLPLILLSALFASFLQLSGVAIKVLIYSLLLVTPLLILIGAVGRVFTLHLRNSGLLMILGGITAISQRKKSLTNK